MTLAQARQRADDRLALLWPVIQAKQDDYLAAHGHYWHGRRTHSGIVTQPTAGSGSADLVADRLVTPVKGEVWTWADFDPSLVDSPLPFVLLMDRFLAAAGQGYVARVYVRFSGKIYTRARQVGPEPWRTHGWREWEGVWQ